MSKQNGPTLALSTGVYFLRCLHGDELMTPEEANETIAPLIGISPSRGVIYTISVLNEAYENLYLWYRFDKCARLDDKSHAVAHCPVEIEESRSDKEFLHKALQIMATTRIPYKPHHLAAARSLK